MPGRKTDVKDAEWIADLVRHGLIAKSFVPPRPLRELRDLLHYRRKLVESQAAERNRLLKLLETANIKLAGFVRATAGRLRWAQHAQTQAAIRPRGRSTRPTRRSAFVCKPGG